VGHWHAVRRASLSEEYLKGKSKGKRGGNKMEKDGGQKKFTTENSFQFSVGASRSAAETENYSLW
jgi:hypothetical protein